jgi:hypothetical protein
LFLASPATPELLGFSNWFQIDTRKSLNVCAININQFIRWGERRGARDKDPRLVLELMAGEEEKDVFIGRNLRITQTQTLTKQRKNVNK